MTQRSSSKKTTNDDVYCCSIKCKIARLDQQPNGTKIVGVSPDYANTLALRFFCAGCKCKER